MIGTLAPGTINSYAIRMRSIGSSVIVAVINGFLAGFFLAQYLTGRGGAENAPTTWLTLTVAFACFAIWRVSLILRALRPRADRAP